VNTPTNLAETLALFPLASFYYWHGGTAPREASLELYFDDFTADRRTIISIQLRKTGIKCTRKSLKKYNDEKQHWELFTGSTDSAFPDRKGERALRELMKREAERLTGWQNTKSFSGTPAK
jgi:hypothetical protein